MLAKLRLFARLALVRPRFAAGYVIVVVVTILAILAPVIAPFSPTEADSLSFLQPPSSAHIFGTDNVGMDIFSRAIYAPRIDLTIAILGTGLSALLGGSLGALVGYYSSGRGIRVWLSFALMRAADVLQAFPIFVFAIALVASLGQSIQTVVLAIAFVNAPIYLRLMRSQVLSIRSMRYVEASQVNGLSDFQTIIRHVIPNAMGPVLAQLSINVGWGIVLTAALSFIGAGVRAPTPEWGSMIAMGFQNVVTGQWWPSMFPGTMLAVTVFGFSLIGASIEVLADPAKRRLLLTDVRLRDIARAAKTAKRASLGQGWRADLMRVLTYLAHRLLFVIPQLFGIILVSFLLVKSVPGDPAVLMLGPTATPAAIASLRKVLGLDQPLYVQFFIYVKNLLHGNLGTSWQTTRPVLDDLIQRFPATLELVTLSLLVAIVVGVTLGLYAATRPNGWIARFADLYGLSVGALPDFWFALVLIFVFYTMLGWAPAPLGRLDMIIIPPPSVTGALTIDTLLAGDLQAFGSGLSHLALPVLTLGLLNAGPILKMTQSTMEKMLESDFSRYEVLCGVPERLVTRHALRNALPSIVTIISVLYGFLIGGAVLVEIVFSWGGAGQYAVQGVLNSDIYPVLGFVLFSAIFSLIVYIVVDLIYVLLDPRISN
jgi:peptide/nickel transport system permease protein